jgi:integrase
VADSSLRYDLATLVRRASVAPLRIHDLRHTHGSLLIRRGKSVKEVAQRLGHKHASLTMDVYLHALPNEHAQTARDLEEWLA